MDIRASEYVFAPYRVDVAADGSVMGIWETFRGNPWDNRGAEKYMANVADANANPRGDVLIEAKLLGKKAFYEERATCEFFSSLLLFHFPSS